MFQQKNHAAIGGGLSMESLTSYSASGELRLVTKALYKLQSVLVPLTLAIGFAQLFQPVPNPDSMRLLFGRKH